MDVARECDQLQFMDRETNSKYIIPLPKKKTVETKLPPPTKDMRTKDPAFPTFVWTLSEDSLARDLESQLKTSPEEELDYMDVEEAPVHSSLNRPSPKVGTACYVGPTKSGNGLVSCKLLCPVSCYTNMRSVGCCGRLALALRRPTRSHLILQVRTTRLTKASPRQMSLDRPSTKVGTACYVGPTESWNGSGKQCPIVDAWVTICIGRFTCSSLISPPSLTTKRVPRLLRSDKRPSSICLRSPWRWGQRPDAAPRV